MFGMALVPSQPNVEPHHLRVTQSPCGDLSIVGTAVEAGQLVWFWQRLVWDVPEVRRPQRQTRLQKLTACPWRPIEYARYSWYRKLHRGAGDAPLGIAKR